MKNLKIEYLVESDRWPDMELLEALVKQAVTAASQAAGLKWLEGAELSLVFTDDQRIAALNEKWRGKPKPTNVLSFPGENIKPGQAAGAMIGDIVLAFETVSGEAEAQQKGFEAHLSHLVIHGFLHLFGYDHGDDIAAEQMEALEIAALQGLGIDDPYDDRTAQTMN